MIRKEPYNILNIGKNIWVFVITGGSCSAKTTAMAWLYRMLSDRGYKVLVGPESATKLILAGMQKGELPWIEFQEEILLDILSQEERLFSIATRYRDKGRKVVVLCDRGTMDGEAYIGKSAFRALMKRLGRSYSELCDLRYHAVMHLRTAAFGAERFYTLANNQARDETPAQARELDEKTLAAWVLHPHPRVIDNSTGIEEKLHRLFVEICSVIGDPIPLEREDKFLVEPFNPSDLSRHVEWNESMIMQDYLVPQAPGEERRVRMRDSGDGATYYSTVKRPVSPGVRAEEEKMITRSEYEALLSLRDPKRLTIKKRRICFFWKEQFFEADLFVDPRPGLALMEAERTDRTPELALPPFIKVITNVTDNKLYSNAEIARLPV